jgi:plastocyanin
MGTVRLLLPALGLGYILSAPRPSAATRHTVRMVGNAFQPRELTIERGDTVRFVLGSGGPHNAAFREATGEAAARLRKVMKDTSADLSGPILIIPGETYDIVFTGVPSGKYPYWCIPHLSGGMMGTIIVR